MSVLQPRPAAVASIKTPSPPRPLEKSRPSLIPSISNALADDIHLNPDDPYDEHAPGESVFIPSANPGHLGIVRYKNHKHDHWGGDHVADHRAKINPAEMDYEAVGKLTPIETVNLARRMDEGSFCYMMPVYRHSHIKHHAYNVHIVPHEKINTADFYTISSSGVERVVDGISEFTSLDRWEQEYIAFVKVQDLDTFSKFRMFKQYYLWRQSVVHRKRVRVGQQLEQGLFILDSTLQPALRQVRNLCLDVVELQLCQIDRTKTYELDDFVATQKAQVSLVSERLVSFRQSVVEIVLEVCKKMLVDREFSIDGSGEVDVMSFTSQVNFVLLKYLAIQLHFCPVFLSTLF